MSQPENGANNSAYRPARYLLPAAFTLSAAAIVVVFWGLFQLDVPVARFVRSLHIPWLEFAGDTAHRLGSGLALALLSGALLVFGWWKQKPSSRQAGLESLLAHGLVAAVVLVLKHVIGRPRPRLMHGNGLVLGPSWDEGLDSFPSGHTSASFAVATVLTRHYPRGAWLFYTAAGLVGLSRVIRGSHYPTDVIAGMALGVVAGGIVTSPLRQWGRTAVRQIIVLSPFLVGTFGLLWTAARLPPPGTAHSVMILVGAVLLVIGIGASLYRWAGLYRKGQGSSRPAIAYEPVLIGLALGLSTGSLLITTLALFVTGAWTLVKTDLGAAEDFSPTPRVPLGVQIGLALALATAVLIIHSIKGILPLVQ